MTSPSLASPRFLYHTKTFKTKCNLQSKRPPTGEAHHTYFNPRVEVLLLKLVTADNSPVSNPPLSGRLFPHLCPRSQVLCSPGGCFCGGQRVDGAGRGHPPQLLCFPRGLPGFSHFPTQGGTRVKRPLKDSRELPW